MLNAGQQLASSIGIAVLGTIFFDVIAGGDFHAGFRSTLLVQVGMLAALLPLSLLLPRFAREPMVVAAAVPELEPV